MKFTIISDIHIGKEKKDKGIIRKMSRYSLPFLNAFINRMNNEIKPLFAVNLGDVVNDIAHDIDIDNLKIAFNVFKKLNCLIYNLVGNHDQKTISIEELEVLFNHKPLYYSFDQEGYHFIALFSEGKDLFIDDDQKKWLLEDLNRTFKKTLIFVHHSLADQDLKGNFWFEGMPERCLIKNRKEIRQVLENSKKVLAVFNGHLHWNKMDVHNGIPYFTIQSLVENFKNENIPSNSYAIIELTPDLIKVDIQGTDSQSYSHKIVSA